MFHQPTLHLIAGVIAHAELAIWCVVGVVIGLSLWAARPDETDY